MNQAQIKLLFGMLGSKATGYRSGWVEGHCVFPWNHGGCDTHPSFAIHEGSPTKKSIGKCLSCGWGGDLLDLIYALKGHLDKEPDSRYDLVGAMQLIAQDSEDFINPLDIPDYEDKVKNDVTVFPEQWLSTFSPISKFNEALLYCASRHLSPGLLGSLDVRYDPLLKRVCFPVRSYTGDLMGVQGRSIEPDTTLRYYQYGYHGKRNSHVWMGENSVNLDDPVVLTEGPFDLASIRRVYPNVLASFTTGLSQRKLGRIADAFELVTFFDSGKGGDAARQKIEDRYGKKMLVTHIVPDEQEDDAGNMSYDSLRSALSNVVPLSTDQVTV